MEIRIQSPIGFLCDHFQISKLLVKQKFQDLSCKLLSHFRICHHGIEEKIIQQVLLFQFFSFILHLHAPFLMMEETASFLQNLYVPLPTGGATPPGPPYRVLLFQFVLKHVILKKLSNLQQKGGGLHGRNSHHISCLCYSMRS